eukprot:6412226-Prymnesium_polylepis.1
MIARLVFPADAADLLRHQRGRVRAYRHRRPRAPKARLVRVVPAVWQVHLTVPLDACAQPTDAVMIPCLDIHVHAPALQVTLFTAVEAVR